MIIGLSMHRDVASIRGGATLAKVEILMASCTSRFKKRPMGDSSIEKDNIVERSIVWIGR